MNSVPALLELEDVWREFPAAGGGAALTVLRQVFLRVLAGESVAIIGPSGSGKSTLLHIIGSLDRPTRGRVRLAGTDLAALTEEQLAAVRNRQIGFVFQSHFLLPHCTVWENVLVPTLAQPGAQEPTCPRGELPESVRGPGGAPPIESVATRATRLLHRVGLGDRLHHRPGQLSGGECQRVAVVRALINRPQLLLADEPTGSLDSASAAALGQLLVDLNREEGVTLIVVTHALDLARRMGRRLRLADGRLVEADV